MKSLMNTIRKNTILFFAFKVLILLIFVVLIDFTIGKVLNYYYFKEQSGLQYRTTYSIEKTYADILVFGSSRANHHYHPDVFEKRLKKSYYNVGRDGSGILYHAAVLKGVLKRYSPKLIILDFNVGEFIKKEGEYDRLSSLLPYYKSHPEMQNIIELKSRYEKYKLLSSIYPYNSTLTTIIAGNLELNKRRKEDNKGYIPLEKVWNQPILTNKGSFNFEIDSVKINFYKSFIHECTNSGVKLYIVCSPVFMRFNHPDYSVALANDIAKKHHIEFYDFTNNITFTNNIEYFADIDHLNNIGAKIFSNIIIDKLYKNK